MASVSAHQAQEYMQGPLGFNRRAFFKRASTINPSDYPHLQPGIVESFRLRDGANKLKRRILGRFRTSRDLTLQELAIALYDTGLVETLTEGEAVAPHLDDVEVCYRRRVRGPVVYTVADDTLWFSRKILPEGERYCVEASYGNSYLYEAQHDGPKKLR